MGLFDTATQEDILSNFSTQKNPLALQAGSSLFGAMNRSDYRNRENMNNILEGYGGIRRGQNPSVNAPNILQQLAVTQEALAKQKESDSALEALKKRVKSGGGEGIQSTRDSISDMAELLKLRLKYGGM